MNLPDKELIYPNRLTVCTLGKVFAGRLYSSHPTYFTPDNLGRMSEWVKFRPDEFVIPKGKNYLALADEYATILNLLKGIATRGEESRFFTESGGFIDHGLILIPDFWPKSFVEISDDQISRIQTQNRDF